jgi:integral membrane protein
VSAWCRRRSGIAPVSVLRRTVIKPLTSLTSEDPVTAADLSVETATAAADAKLARFRTVSLAEGISFLVLLCIAMPLKYAANLPIAVMIAGMVHGLLFLAYVGLAWDQRIAQRWDAKRFLVVLVASVLPTGPFWLHKSLKK